MKLKTHRERFLQIIPILISLITGCFVAQSPPIYLPIDSSSEAENRERNPRRYNSRGTGECDRDRRCEEICNDLFHSFNHRAKCEELSITDVERMEEVFRVLEDPDTDDLRALDLEDLERLLNISLNPLETAIGRMTQTEKNKFLVWMALDVEATDLLEAKEVNFEILKELFGTIKGVIVNDLNSNIGGGDTFIELALETENEVALEWIHDFFGNICNRESNEQRCIFEDFYCELSLNGDAEEEYFDYEFFEDLLNEILVKERKTTGSITGCSSLISPDCWWQPDGDTDAGDLDRWKSSRHNVCGSLR